ncbi:MAG: glycosyltransferase, partial [Gammaproteobacteria bacterium]|nr:glycosyltransferase [Gammaproteobacteria bacterium]
LLKGFKALPGEIFARTWLFVLGDDDADPFQRLAARLGIDERVRFMGGRPDVPDFLFAADAFVLPAYDENAGMAILEAMIAGTPALVTQNCGYARYLHQARAGLITPTPYDQDTFNAQLAELITSDQRADWARNGRALADDERIYQLAQRAVDLFEDFAGSPRTIAKIEGKDA